MADIWTNGLGSLASNGSERRKEMTTYKTGGIAEGGAAIIVGLLIGLVAAQLVNPTPPPANASQSAAFDHSNCQYPDRWSNPADGCDNSDPAVPECIKAFSTKEGEEACIATFVGTAEKQQAIAEHDAPFNQTAPAKVSECGVK